jgi:hypothetical protein
LPLHSPPALIAPSEHVFRKIFILIKNFLFWAKLSFNY